ncbi:cyclic nucleotide-binding domain-containing protein [Rhizobiales bacterium RZME27]|uniref:Cyclic nucleotide-binding domain-containing protein n=1 Tax=Endobacterium cereale TaxID=2663029 RepID=A0A6A8AGN3_9HYPH|nr:cyclic nucleotide-binding domain-containing protein [Endobacterium cereale]MEB2847580.1 cyclic nucleotide-binding domain-containing protein [Endobacterium cereale]MQY47961.1 cyclic nucleotide-binding domain-containing protein [Endobacterium cereale]
MALADDIRLLSQVPLFSDMDGDQLRLIAFGAERRTVAHGQALFREHSPAECAFVVASGRFQLSTLGRDGHMQVEKEVGSGALLSELALITMVERKYTAVALQDSDVLKVTRTLFHRLLEEYPRAAQILQARIRDNLVRMAQAAAAMESRFQ